MQKIEVTPEQLDYIRTHISTDGSRSVISTLGMSISKFYSVCKEYGINTRADIRTQCNPPEDCFDCPHKDCIRGGSTKREAEFTKNAIS